MSTTRPKCISLLLFIRKTRRHGLPSSIFIVLSPKFPCLQVKISLDSTLVPRRLPSPLYMSCEETRDRKEECLMGEPFLFFMYGEVESSTEKDSRIKSSCLRRLDFSPFLFLYDRACVLETDWWSVEGHRPL